ncbi:hypothetical protein ACFPJ1_10320 [Kribbella qitaiheensis]|uniref:hypothetical protein n=1 Tax=Kribbella qitaiheensis TaxID=1544730 RepID=UPI0036179A1B
MPLSAAQRSARISTAEPPADTKMILRRAVVLGASMAGLVAARMLSDHAEEMIVIEWDESQATDEPRPGVPQGSQVHALLPAVQATLDRWFPGFYADAVAAGAIVPQPGSVELYLDGALKVTSPTQTVNPATVSTRPLRRFAAVVGDARQLD